MHLKFTPAGGRVTVGIDQQKEQILLRVSDTGIGITVDQQKEIFKEFSRAIRRGWHGEKSSGLSLYIVKKIVALHRAELRMESEEGKGITFIVLLKA